MKITSVRVVYFSATYTTQKIVRAVAQTFGAPVVEHDITCAPPDLEITVTDPGELLVVGAPVYAGRIPSRAAEALKRTSGDNTPAIAVCVYGNRDYDDALIELADIIEGRGFRVVAAGAFVAQHSIFPKLAQGRPDERDMLKISAFGKRCMETLSIMDGMNIPGGLEVRGKRPYKAAKVIPIVPKGSKRGCNLCGACARLCPTEAIDKDAPSLTDKRKCISCGRCVVVCPRGVRHFSGMLYTMVGKKLLSENALRKEPDWFFP